MAELHDSQAGFAAALRDAASSQRAHPWLAGDAAMLDRRLAIYRANVAASADKALSAAYPVVRQVVGDEFFGGLARAYLRAHPSTSGDLGEFGADFAGFLADFPPVHGLAYLPDLARLEWRAQVAYGAADAVAWDRAPLAALDSGQQERLCFAWAPGAAVVASGWPIVQLWTIHQAGHAGAFTVDWARPEQALVARDGFAVTVTVLSPADAAFVAASMAGATLAEAAGAAFDVAPGFDLASLFGRVLKAGLIRGFTVD